MDRLDKIITYFKKKPPEDLSVQKKELGEKIDELHRKMSEAKHVSEIDTIEREVNPLMAQLEELNKKSPSA